MFIPKHMFALVAEYTLIGGERNDDIKEELDVLSIKQKGISHKVERPFE